MKRNSITFQIEAYECKKHPLMKIDFRVRYKVSVHDIHSGDSLLGNHSFPFLWVITAEIGSDQEKTPPLIFYELSKTVFKIFLAWLGPKLEGMGAIQIKESLIFI